MRPNGLSRRGADRTGQGLPGSGRAQLDAGKPYKPHCITHSGRQNAAVATQNELKILFKDIDA